VRNEGGLVDRTGIRIGSLDGLRALSIALVIFGHLGGTRGFPVGYPRPILSFAGTIGVRIFFVISGYLITRLLLEERRARGSIRLSNFYFKRIFRIFVPYYAFLAAIAVAARLGWVELSPGDLGYGFLYLSDYHLHGEWTLGHTWSLAVEEQFYLLWPVLLVVLGVRRALWIAAGYLLLAPMGRLFVWYMQPELRDGIGHTFGTVADTIASGCLLAGASEWLSKSVRYRRLLQSPWFFLVPLAVLGSLAFENRPRLAFTIGAAIINIGVALCVDRCIRLPDSAATKLLAAAPIVAIGRASYSIYLWQQPFLNRYTTGLPASFPQNLAVLVVAVLGAYLLIERPSLALRSALQARWSRAFRAPRRLPAAAPTRAWTPPPVRA
jgi:peptidoglycan/LPS O-acetylase OafA/YrhL